MIFRWQWFRERLNGIQVMSQQLVSSSNELTDWLTITQHCRLITWIPSK